MSNKSLNHCKFLRQHELRNLQEGCSGLFLPFLHWLFVPGSLLKVHMSALPYYPSAAGLSTLQLAGGLPASHQVMDAAQWSGRGAQEREEAVETTTVTLSL